MSEDLFKILFATMPWASLISAISVVLVKFFGVLPVLLKERNRRFVLKAFVAGKLRDESSGRLAITLVISEPPVVRSDADDSTAARGQEADPDGIE